MKGCMSEWDFIRTYLVIFDKGVLMFQKGSINYLLENEYSINNKYHCGTPGSVNSRKKKKKNTISTMWTIQPIRKMKK